MYTTVAGKVKERRSKMTVNNAGGLAFQINDWQRLDRFLIIGSSSGTYYVGAQKLTLENALAVARCLGEHGPRVVDRIVEISDQGRAPSNDPALFALAMAASYQDDHTRAYALAKLPKVARTGTHLFHFAAYVNAMRGWGRSLRGSIANWYQAKELDTLAYQAVKYQQRDGWSHRDLLRLSHPKTDDPVRNAIYKWIVDGDTCSQSFIDGYTKAQRAVTESELIKLILDYNLTREMLPTQWLNSRAVWEALLAKMPLEAMVRNLGKMSHIGLVLDNAEAIVTVVERLHQQAYIKHSRLHPLAILEALKVYGQGHGEKGKLTWAVNSAIIHALDDAFYLAFDNVAPTNKSIMLGLDVSSSMSACSVPNSPLSCAEAAVVMALVTARREPQHVLKAFSSRLVDPKINPDDRLEDALRKTRAIIYGGTDCSLLTQYALAQQEHFDGFVTYTKPGWVACRLPH